MIWKNWGGCSPPFCSMCWKPLVQNPSELSFSEVIWEEHICSHKKLCARWDSSIATTLCKKKKHLDPVKPKSIKEFQVQRIYDTARPAQVYLVKCICFCKRSTTCLQCFWRPGSQKGNPKLTHRLAHNCLRMDDFLRLPVILSLIYGWLPLSSKCLLVQWELPVVLWQTSN